MTLTKVASLKDVKPGNAKHISFKGHELALFNCGGKIFATDGICPHQAGFLAEGLLDGHVVTCPLHGWRFDVKTGKGMAPAAPGAAVKIYKVVLAGSDIMVDL
jgi:nitrite reductase (NADH) small subunit